MVRARPGTSTAPRRRRRPPTPEDDAGVAIADPLPPDESLDEPEPYSNGAHTGTTVDVADLAKMPHEQLLELAPEIGLRDDGSLADLNRDALFQRVRQTAANRNLLTASGILEVMDAGHGLLRSLQYPPVTGDVFVGQSQIRRFNLKTGDTVSGLVRPPKEGERRYGLTRATSINLLDPEQQKPGSRRAFESLTPIFPDDHIVLENPQGGLPSRMIDLFAPIGLGQRGLVVSPPKAGKTTVLKQIAAAVADNRPDVILMVVLIGERPEEVTEMRRAVKGEVFASTFDEFGGGAVPGRRAGRGARQAHDRIRPGRGHPAGQHHPPHPRLQPWPCRPQDARYPAASIRRPFTRPSGSSARPATLEEGGSLTIIATCLLDTGSRMDEVIYEEFKGTGNMELHLDRRLADQRYFPAIDVVRSGTRREELLYDAETVPQIWLLRRMVTLASGGDQANMGDATKRRPGTPGAHPHQRRVPDQPDQRRISV